MQTPDNDYITDLLSLTVKLMELHDENPFKVKAIAGSLFKLEKVADPLAGLSAQQLDETYGIGKSLSQKIVEIADTGDLAEANDLLSKTPIGVLDMLGIKGIGPKKVRTIWKELGIEDKIALLEACEKNEISALKGFGDKTQETIKNSLLYEAAQIGKLLYSQAEVVAAELVAFFKQSFENASDAGDVRLKREIVEHVLILVSEENPTLVMDLIAANPAFEKNIKSSSPYSWKGKYNGALTEVKVFPKKDFFGALLRYSAAPEHLAFIPASKQTILQISTSLAYNSEEEIYKSVGLPYITPEIREGYFEFELAQKGEMPVLLDYKDLKGAFHNHSKWSDGKNTIEEMAQFCIEQGWSYLGMADHSKTAQYANGLYENRVLEQQKEIDGLNQKLNSFKIFKGIESDILADGSLDYEEDILKSFDYVVASVHANLNMDEEKATKRILTAIENPYTTMLGHPTGRLLLRREGYPIDHEQIIDACKANDVIIEINANPWRLDIDWRWVHVALEKGVILSINPDAHKIHGLLDMYYGVQVGRKGGLTATDTFNTWDLEKVEAYFKNRKINNGI